MPSDLKPPEDKSGVSSRHRCRRPTASHRFKLLGQLFIIPLLLVSAAVGIMFLIGVFAGSDQTPSLSIAMDRLKNPGGGRTADLLVGPGSKQRYIDAKSVADHLMRARRRTRRALRERSAAINSSNFWIKTRATVKATSGIFSCSPSAAVGSSINPTAAKIHPPPPKRDSAR